MLLLIHRKHNRECWLLPILKEIYFIFAARLLRVALGIILKCDLSLGLPFPMNMNLCDMGVS